jgi:hypothetical protein
MIARWTRWLYLIGVVLVLPGACEVASDAPVTTDDGPVALTPVARLSLESLRSGQAVEVLVRVPDSAQWQRIRQDSRLGDKGYIVLAAVKRHERIIPLSTLALDVVVIGPHGPIALDTPPYSPFLYSSRNLDVGVRFHPEPGAETRIRVAARKPETLPPGELIIEPLWDWSATDVGDTAGADSLLHAIAVKTTRAGFAFLGLAVALSGFERLRGSQSVKL